MIRKSVAELVVIVAGVVIGLAADRWIKTIDNRTEESRYLAGLVDNLRADSLRLAMNAQRADTAGAQTLDLLLFVEDSRLPSDVDTAQFLGRVTTLSYFTPTDFARDTWDDLVSSGKIEAISDDSLRKTLSAYYNAMDRLSAVERDWEGQLSELEVASWRTLPPMGRLTIYGDSGVPQDIRTSYPPMKVLAGVRATIRSDAELQAALGQARIIRAVSRKRYAGSLASVSKVLAEVKAQLKQ